MLKYVLDLSKLEERKAYRIFTWLKNSVGESNCMTDKITKYAYLGITETSYCLLYDNRLYDDYEEVNIYTFIINYMSSYNRNQLDVIKHMNFLCEEILKGQKQHKQLKTQ